MAMPDTCARWHAARRSESDYSRPAADILAMPGVVVGMAVGVAMAAVFTSPNCSTGSSTAGRQVLGISPACAGTTTSAA
jgi:hypothetical protein